LFEAKLNTIANKVVKGKGCEMECVSIGTI